MAVQLVEALSNRQDPRELDVLKTLRHAFVSGDHEELNTLREQKAQIALDIMQEARKIRYLKSSDPN